MTSKSWIRWLGAPLIALVLTIAQPGPPAEMAALDSADRPIELSRGLLVGEPFEVAEHHGRTISIGELAQLLVDHRCGVVPG